jgi:hypothetical protein
MLLTIERLHRYERAPVAQNRPPTAEHEHEHEHEAVPQPSGTLSLAH